MGFLMNGHSPRPVLQKLRQLNETLESGASVFYEDFKGTRHKVVAFFIEYDRIEGGNDVSAIVRNEYGEMRPMYIGDFYVDVTLGRAYYRQEREEPNADDVPKMTGSAKKAYRPWWKFWK